jgi:hypothetical protein
MHHTILALTVAVCWSGGLAPAAEPSPLPQAELTGEKALRELSETALDRLMRGESEGFDLLRRHAGDPTTPEALGRYFREQADRVKAFQRKWGAPLKYELVVRQKAGETFCRFVYLCKYERSFLRWVFTYYRPKEKWIFFRVDFDDDVTALFEDAASAKGPADKD